MRRRALLVFSIAAGLLTAGSALWQNSRGHAQQATRPAPKAPLGVIPGAAPGSPAQAPDTSNFDYASLFHDLQPDDTTGFRQIFDGRTLTGWDGDPRFWRVENGAIVGESTPQAVISDNTFLIWRGGTLKDFELTIDFHLSGTNSGVQIRSVELPSVGRWVMKGYQADMDFANLVTGNLHDERGRDVIVPRGYAIRITDGPAFHLIGTIADPVDIRGLMNVDNWNRYHIIARGPTIMQFLNGRLTAVLIDEDTKNRVLEGLLGLQMHVGPPFKVEFKNIWYKAL